MGQAHVPSEEFGDSAVGFEISAAPALGSFALVATAVSLAACAMARMLCDGMVAELALLLLLLLTDADVAFVEMSVEGGLSLGDAVEDGLSPVRCFPVEELTGSVVRSVEKALEGFGAGEFEAPSSGDGLSGDAAAPPVACPRYRQRYIVIQQRHPIR